MPINSTKKASSRKKKQASSTTPSKTGQVRELLTQGLGATEITRKLNCSRSLVYLVKDQIAQESAAKPITLADLPPNAVRAAEHWPANLPKDMPLVQAQCVNCLMQMWTRDPKIENLCEICSYQMMTEVAEAVAAREIHRTPPTFDEDDTGKGIPDFGNPFRLF